MTLDALAWEQNQTIRLVWVIPGKDTFPGAFVRSPALFLALHADTRMRQLLAAQGAD